MHRRQQGLPSAAGDRVTVSDSASSDRPTALDFPDCRACQMWKDAGASWPRPCKRHYGPFPDGWPDVPSLIVTLDGKVTMAAPLMDARQSFDVGPYKVWITR